MIIRELRLAAVLLRIGYDLLNPEAVPDTIVTILLGEISFSVVGDLQTDMGGISHHGHHKLRRLSVLHSICQEFLQCSGQEDRMLSRNLSALRSV